MSFDPRLQAILDQGQAELARRELLSFTERMEPGYIAGMVHHRIAAFLERAIHTPDFRGVLVVPPRHGKSALASVNLPAWYLGRYPDRQIIASSHTQELTNDFSRQARGKIGRPEYPFTDVQLAHDSSAVQQWEVVSPRGRKRGRYQAVGAGGSPAGRGCDFMLVDDPVKNAAAAESAIEREGLWRWFTTDMLTRLQPGGSTRSLGWVTWRGMERICCRSSVLIDHH